MDFFQGQESLSVFQWAMRALVAYLFLLLAVKFMGQRSISQLRLLDFATALILGNILAHPLSDEKLGLLGPLVTTVVMAILYFLGTLLSIKCEPCRRFFEPTPVALIKNGQVIYQSLAKARVSIDSLLTELRKKKAPDLQKVAAAYWEPDGTLSVFMQPQFEPVTPSDLLLPTKSFSIPEVVVKEGKIKFDALVKMGKDQSWLSAKVKEKVNTEIKNVLLATLDDSGNLHVILKHPPGTFFYRPS